MWFEVDYQAALVLMACLALVRSKCRAASSLSPTLWIIMSVDAALSAICFLTSNDWSDGGVNFCSEAVATVIVAIVALCYGQVRFTVEDRTDLLSCAAAVVLWVVALICRWPLAGELSLLAIGAIGVIAFLRSVVRNPRGEDLFVWSLFLLTDLQAVTAFKGESVTGFCFLGLELATSLGVVAVFVVASYLVFFEYRRYKLATRGRGYASVFARESLRLKELLFAQHASSRLLLARALADA